MAAGRAEPAGAVRVGRGPGARRRPRTGRHGAGAAGADRATGRRRHPGGRADRRTALPRRTPHRPSSAGCGAGRGAGRRGRRARRDPRTAPPVEPGRLPPRRPRPVGASAPGAPTGHPRERARRPLRPARRERRRTAAGGLRTAAADDGLPRACQARATPAATTAGVLRERAARERRGTDPPGPALDAGRRRIRAPGRLGTGQRTPPPRPPGGRRADGERPPGSRGDLLRSAAPRRGRAARAAARVHDRPPQPPRRPDGRDQRPRRCRRRLPQPDRRPTHPAATGSPAGPHERAALVREVSKLRCRLAYWLQQAGDPAGVHTVYRDLISDDEFLRAVAGRLDPRDFHLLGSAAVWRARAGTRPGRRPSSAPS